VRPERRREILDAVKSIPAKHRAWLSLPVSVEGFELFCYHGWGVVPNDAQLESVQDIIEWPAGSIHLWRFANRTGKTSGLTMGHTYFVWKKWRYLNADADGWLGYRYKTLHSAPSGKLMGKAWEMADALIDGSSILQRNPITSLQRPGIFVNAPWFNARTGKAPDGTESMFIQCLNGGVVDFLQTEGGAGRMESDAWWVISWDEFGEHQPVDQVPYLFNSRFLPRSSDFMAPVILSSTENDKSAPVYMELEDIAERSPGDWNLKEFGRAVNFAQSKESIDRQLRLSTDLASAQRSVYGGAAEGSSGSLLAAFTLKRAFDRDLPVIRSIEELPAPPDGRKWRIVQTFDHAVKNDRNVVLTAIVAWPVLGREDLIGHPARVLDLAEMRGSRVLLPDEMAAFAFRQWERFGARIPGSVWLTDATGEAGIMVHRMLRQKGVPSREFNFTARVSQTDRRTKKGYGRTGLMRLFSLGLPIDEQTSRVILAPGTDPEDLPFGGIRIPHPEQGQHDALRRLYRQLAMLRADDEKLVQDHAMTALMFAAYLYPTFERVPRPAAPAVLNPFGTRGDRFRGLARLR